MPKSMRQLLFRQILGAKQFQDMRIMQSMHLAILTLRETFCGQGARPDNGSARSLRDGTVVALELASSPALIWPLT
jgi:hypothetical protein